MGKGVLMASCTFINEFGNRCVSTWQLNKFFFYDPQYNSLEIVLMCQTHSDDILSFMLLEIKKHQSDLSKISHQIKIQKKNAREFDRSFDSSLLFNELESKRELITRIRWRFCRWPVCETPPLTDELIYSCIVFSVKGRLRHIFYFHEKCMKQFKGKCGIMQLITTGKRTL